MYCKYCGKYTCNEDAVCDECKGAQPVQDIEVPEFFKPVSETPATPAANDGASASGLNRKFGLVFGIIALVASFIGLSIGATYVGDMLTEVYLKGNGQIDYDTALEIVATIKSGVPALVVAILLGASGIVLGAVSIRKFKVAKRSGVKPVATLVLGIAGIAVGALGILYCLIMLRLAFI